MPTPVPTVGGGQAPYVAVSAPGRIEAEDFDTGGSGRAWFDTDPDVNTGGQYRDTGVDIWVTQNGEGYTVGRTREGEWLEYSFDVPTEGTFVLRGRVATGFETPGRIRAGVDGSYVGRVAPDSSGWWNWQQLDFGTVTLTPGRHVLRLTWENGGQVNIDRVDVLLEGGGGLDPEPLPPFECTVDNGVLSWTDHRQARYWMYVSTDGVTYTWLGRTLGDTTFTDPAAGPGRSYQVHYEGIPRENCEDLSG